MSRVTVMAGLAAALALAALTAWDVASSAPAAPQDDPNSACPAGMVRVKATGHTADRNRNGYICRAPEQTSPTGAKPTPGPQVKPSASPPPAGGKGADGARAPRSQIAVVVVDDRDGTCPPGYTPVKNVPTHPADANKNGVVCGRVKGSSD